MSVLNVVEPVLLTPGVLVVILWAHGEESRGSWVGVRAHPQNPEVVFVDEVTGEEDSIPLSMVHTVESL